MSVISETSGCWAKCQGLVEGWERGFQTFPGPQLESRDQRYLLCPRWLPHRSFGNETGVYRWKNGEDPELRDLVREKKKSPSRSPPTQSPKPAPNYSVSPSSVRLNKKIPFTCFSSIGHVLMVRKSLLMSDHHFCCSPAGSLGSFLVNSVPPCFLLASHTDSSSLVILWLLMAPAIA